VISKPQLGDFDFSDAPHSPQNFMPLAFSKPQAAQRIEVLQEIVANTMASPNRPRGAPR
jgi:hypothetical protein